MFFTKTKLFEYLCRNEFVIKRSRKIKKKKKNDTFKKFHLFQTRFFLSILSPKLKIKRKKI